MVVSHTHPSTAESVALLSKAMIPGLQDSASVGEEEFFWSVDIHCGSGDDDSDSGGSDSGGGGSVGSGGGGSDDGIGSDRSSIGAGGSDGGASDGERSGEERGDQAAEEEGEGGGGGGSDSLGPSVYMARKVGEKDEFTRRWVGAVTFPLAACARSLVDYSANACLSSAAK